MQNSKQAQQENDDDDMDDENDGENKDNRHHLSIIHLLLFDTAQKLTVHLDLPLALSRSCPMQMLHFKPHTPRINTLVVMEIKRHSYVSQYPSVHRKIPA